MIQFLYRHVCDICGVAVENTAYYSGNSVTPCRPLGWSSVNGQDICPKHTVKIEDAKVSK